MSVEVVRMDYSIEGKGDKDIELVIKDMVEFTKSLSVTTEESYKTLDQIYSDAREWQKELDLERKRRIDPYRKKINRENDRAKLLSDPLDEIIEIAKIKMTSYKKILEKQKEDEIAKAKEAQELFDFKEEIYVAPLEKNMKGENTLLISKVEKKFRVLDIAKVPAKYLMVNETMITRDMKLGIDEIDGIEFYEETTTQLRKR